MGGILLNILMKYMKNWFLIAIGCWNLSKISNKPKEIGGCPTKSQFSCWSFTSKITLPVWPTVLLFGGGWQEACGLNETWPLPLGHPAIVTWADLEIVACTCAQNRQGEGWWEKGVPRATGAGGGGGGGQVPLRAQKKASLTTVASTRGKDKGLAFRKYIDVLTIHLPFLPIFLFSPSSFSPHLHFLPFFLVDNWWYDENPIMSQYSWKLH